MNQTPHPRPPLALLCPACGKEMRLVLAKPAPHFVNLGDCTFECECGEQNSFVMARTD
jgi:C4-type Zn-finger protein